MKKSLLVGFSLMSALLLASCSSTTNSSASSSHAKSSKVESSEDESSQYDDAEDSDTSDDSTSSGITYGLNEEAVIGTGDTDYYGLTFTSATKKFDAHGQTLVNSDITSLAISNEKSVQFTVNYSNKGDSDSWIPSIYDFAVYDESGQAGEVVDQQEGQTEVSQGHSGTTTFWVNFSNVVPAGSQLEAEYQPDGMDEPIKFDLTVN